MGSGHHGRILKLGFIIRLNGRSPVPPLFTPVKRSEHKKAALRLLLLRFIENTSARKRFSEAS
ncbi:MAG: hypothetical protein ACJAUE_002201 [Alcanivorax sp.]|jgi:hypothetical protein